MKKIAILLASFAFPGTAQAQTFLEARTVPAKVRYGYVYDHASRACPAAENHLFKQGTKVSYIGHVANKAAMSSDERSLLFLMCAMYDQGVRTPAH